MNRAREGAVTPRAGAAVLALLAAGCGWELPTPAPAPDAGGVDRPLPTDRGALADAPDAPPRDTPPLRDAPSPMDMPAMDRPAPTDLPPPTDLGFADVPTRPDVPLPVDVAIAVDVPMAPDAQAPDVAAADATMTECVPSARRSCYTGPTMSRGVGLCRDGVQTCLPTGRWGTACDGQSLPFCVDRVCGADGCGGSCGTCPSGQRCDDTGRCVAPTCGNANFTITCPDSTRCPRDSHCDTGGRCACDEGFVAESCGGTVCGACPFPDWWCRRAYFCGAGAISCAGGYLCPVRSRCDVATRSCICDAGYVAVDCTGARCTTCPGVSYRCVLL